jgi:hypothetical protein
MQVPDLRFEITDLKFEITDFGFESQIGNPKSKMTGRRGSARPISRRRLGLGG